jgi:CTP:molybdopterin cytidylyltransferase MocA
MGTPKALVSDDEGPWLLRAIATLRSGGCDAVTVVLGAQADQAAQLLVGEDVEIVVADDWDKGMGVSLRTGLRHATGSPADGVLVSLVDLPDLVPEVVGRVLAAAEGPAALARATYNGRPGHPVLIGRDHWPGVIDTAVGDHGARVYLSAHDVTLVECGDLATGRDVDSR